jgi:NADH-quinone oxidoreductase subunit L
VVTAPLILLAVASVVIGYLTIQPMLFGDFFEGRDHVDAAPPGDGATGRNSTVPWAMALHGADAAVLAGVAGVATAWCFYLKPVHPGGDRARFEPSTRVLENKYYFDWFNEKVLAPPARGMLGRGLWKGGDQG